MDIVLPYRNFQFRPYQQDLFDYLMSGKKGLRAFCLWHRRCGKDEAMLHITLMKMIQRKGTYWYIFPTYAHARRAVWNMVDPHIGMKRLDAVIPSDIIAKKNSTEMSITLINGSVLQFIGADNPENLKGSSPCGIVISEYTKVPQVLYSEVIYPILQENDGWIVFNTTPSGKNHAYYLWQAMQENFEFFTSKVTIKDSKVFSDEKIQEIYNEYIELYGEENGRAIFAQEYLCSFESPRSGSYYGSLIEKSRNDGRVFDMSSTPFFKEIIDSPIDEMLCALDLGVDDATALWFFKRYKDKIFVCGYHQDRRLGAKDYADYIRSKYPQVRRLIVPHDAKVQEWGSGKTRIEALVALGFRPLVAPNVSLTDGIFAVRETFPCVYFDEKNTSKGIEALGWYHQDFKDTIGAYTIKPRHDWSSHAADAFRYLCLWCKKVKNEH